MRGTRRSIEEAMFRGYWDDGLVDLMSGLGLLGIGACWTLGWPVFGAVLPGLLLPLWPPLHRALVEPRAGYVEFSRDRQRGRRRGLNASIGLGLLVLAVVVVVLLSIRAGRLPLAPGPWSAGLPAVLLALMAAVAAGLLGARRFYLYGLALLVAAALTVALAWEPGVAMLLVGGLVTLCGGALMTSFVRASEAWAEGTP